MMQNTCFCLFLLFLISCNKSEPIDHQVLFVDTDVQLRDIVQFDDNLVIVGGNLWESGLVIDFDVQSNEFITNELSTQSLLAIAEEDGQLFTTGLTNSKYVFDDDQWQNIQLDSNYIRRGICRQEGQSIIVGGQAFFEGYIELLNSDNELNTIIQVPHQLNDIANFQNGELLAVGYGAIYNSIDGGISWQLVNAEGDFFQSVHYSDTSNSVFIIGQSGLTYQAKAGQILDKLSDGNMLNKHYRDIISFNNQLIRIGDLGLMEMTELDNIDWQTIELETSSNLLAIHEYLGTIYILTERGELLSLKI